MVNNKEIIYEKLQAFIRRFYANELIKGCIFFIGLGLLYFLFTVFVEYFLWLSPNGRRLLFVIFILFEIILLGRYILYPIAKLIKIQKGLDFEQASLLIGKHFSEVSDKLTNFLQLSKDNNQSELLLASIDQKADSLKFIPFGKAVDFRKNIKFLPIAIIPVLIILLLMFSNNLQLLSQSYHRVVNYNEQFIPPAPFSFVIENSKLQTEQGKDFVLQIRTEGKVVPEKVNIQIADEQYLLQSGSLGSFSYKFSKPLDNVNFKLVANQVESKNMSLDVIKVPSIEEIELRLIFPSYLNRKSEILKGTANATVPEGTTVEWKLITQSTENVGYKDAAIKGSFSRSGNNFGFKKIFSSSTDYQILTGNNKVSNYEILDYSIGVVKDQFPTINVENLPDSLKSEKKYLLGQISDDYGLHKLEIIYYTKDNPQSQKRGAITIKGKQFDQFVFSFPSNLPVELGKDYEYFFEVRDNDALHNYKATRSVVFSSRIFSENEKETQLIQEQNSNINSMSQSIKEQEKQFSDLEKLQKEQKEKSNLEYKDQKKIDDFVERQKRQDEMMKEFSEKMAKNLDNIKQDKKDNVQEELQKRFEKVAEELEKNKKLLDELNQLKDKIQNEKLFEKMEQFKKQSKNQTKTLEQLVELTKKYYVEKKAEQIADNLKKLAEKQDKLADKQDDKSLSEQKDINKEFEQLKSELDQLEKDNKALKSPMDLENDAKKEEEISKDLKDAEENLEKKNAAKAKPKQKKAAKQMMEMGQKMSSSIEMDSKEQMEEDVKMLRQILDNLVAFSFSQESLMKQFRALNPAAPSFNKHLKQQQTLKQQFRHVDDSLFALSMRNPKIAEQVTKEVGDVHYYLDKSIGSIVEGQIPQGNAQQQYTVTHANTLANMLSDILNNMQMSLSGSGMGKPSKGKGEGGGQLPDIIKKQVGLGEKMKGEKGKKGEGSKPGEGKKPGESGMPQSGEGGQGSDGEGDAEKIMEIYKEQVQLRERLQNELIKNGMGGNGQAVQQMKQLEKQLLDKGITDEAVQKAMNIKYELLMLEKAMRTQGEESKRQAESSGKDFNNSVNALPKEIQKYLNSIEILNRQSLPLRPNFSTKVQQYFKSND